MGNFVETKKTKLGQRLQGQPPHLSRRRRDRRKVNVGAGTITCNYDGVHKHQTIIEDGVFVGSDSTLVAPVTIGKGSYVGAGSCITDDVPADALAIGRGRQINKADWARLKREAMATQRGCKERDRDQPSKRHHCSIRCVVNWNLSSGWSRLHPRLCRHSIAWRTQGSREARREWSRFCGQILSRGDFAFYRFVPTASWTTAEFLFEDEQSNHLGPYLSQSRVRADLELRGKTYQMFIQRSGAFASEWAGKVGGTTDSTIVIRTADQLITELSVLRKFPAWSYAFVADGRHYSVVGGGLLPTKPVIVSAGTEQADLPPPQHWLSKVLLPCTGIFLTQPCCDHGCRPAQ